MYVGKLAKCPKYIFYVVLKSFADIPIHGLLLSMTFLIGFYNEKPILFQAIKGIWLMYVSAKCSKHIFYMFLKSCADYTYSIGFCMK